MATILILKVNKRNKQNQKCFALQITSKNFAFLYFFFTQLDFEIVKSLEILQNSFNFPKNIVNIRKNNVLNTK